MGAVPEFADLEASPHGCVPQAIDAPEVRVVCATASTALFEARPAQHASRECWVIVSGIRNGKTILKLPACGCGCGGR